MYTDYPTIYESTINQNLIYLILLAILLVILLLITTISLAKIFKKANRPFIAAFIPFYNIFVLLEIINLPKLYFVLLLIPVANLVIYVNLMIALAKFFRKSKLFGIGLVFLPFIFYPILAFSDSEYIGINIIAMEGKSIVTNIPPVITDEEKNPVVHEEVDNSSKNMNISIGGGVYQKNYTKDLLQVDEKQTIINSKNTTINQKNEINSINEINNSLPSNFIDNNINKVEEIKQNNNNMMNIDDIISIKPITINEEKKEVPIQNNNVNPIKPEIKQDDFTICPKCGTKVKNGVKTCFLCGNTLQ